MITYKYHYRDLPSQTHTHDHTHNHTHTHTHTQTHRDCLLQEKKFFICLTAKIASSEILDYMHWFELGVRHYPAGISSTRER